MQQILLVFLLLVFVDFGLCAAGPRLVVQDDSRPVFLVQPFCFSSLGNLELKATGIKLGGNDPTEASKAGFVVMRAQGAYSSNAAEYAASEEECILDKKDYTVYKISSAEMNEKMTFTEDNSGHYYILFVNCNVEAPATFDLTLLLTNDGKFLPAGDLPLPPIYGFLSFCFVCAGFFWIYSLKTGAGATHKIHLLMGALVFVKAISLGLEAIRLVYINIYDDGYGWSVAYYIFTFLKGTMLFGILLLIGTGLFVLKAFLNERDKKIILVVLPMQCITNIAMIVVEETPPGTMGWLTWRDILHLFDIICCCAILFPIVWSIRHLRESAHDDGQASRSLSRLKLFREFYIMVVCYIYFTRIIVYLVRATLPCKFSWIAMSTSEIATLVFFVAVGYQFRPQGMHPYLSVDDELRKIICIML